MTNRSSSKKKQSANKKINAAHHKKKSSDPKIKKLELQKIKDLLQSVLNANSVDAVKDAVFSCAGVPFKMHQKCVFRRLVDTHTMGYLAESGTDRSKYVEDYVIQGMIANGGRFFKIELSSQDGTPAIRQLLPASDKDRKTIVTCVHRFFRTIAERMARQNNHDMDKKKVEKKKKMEKKTKRDDQEGRLMTHQTMNFKIPKKNKTSKTNKTGSKTIATPKELILQEPVPEDIAMVEPAASPTSKTFNSKAVATLAPKDDVSVVPSLVSASSVAASSSAASKGTLSVHQEEDNTQEDDDEEAYGHISIPNLDDSRHDDCVSPLSMDEDDDESLPKEDFLLPPPSALRFTESMGAHSLGSIACDDDDDDDSAFAAIGGWHDDDDDDNDEPMDLIMADLLPSDSSVGEMHQAMYRFHAARVHGPRGSGGASLQGLAKHLRSVVDNSSELLQRVEVLGRMEQEQAKFTNANSMMTTTTTTTKDEDATGGIQNYGITTGTAYLVDLVIDGATGHSLLLDDNVDAFYRQEHH
ncbi:expressed unknown protein [Seminavis robusta]|uniref:Uncharacterized protein n=1 Tax=Seminavis robusta TaxID=568900 RepID=A0A9N8I062_9STRA|nr:expressed unknown protein [Seminavis robusta]|eukprot:Sro2530_g330430.1 n/a (526) ;mRNA; r:6913-8490